MKAIILAAGRGSRMKDLTENKPKCLNKFKGLTLLDWQIKAIKNFNIDEIGIITGYKSEQLEIDSIRKFENKDWENTQMVASLMQADIWLSKTECFVTYSDLFYMGNGIKDLIQSKHDISIAYDQNWRSIWEGRFSNPLDDAESFQKNKDSFLTSIGEKVENISLIEGQYMGILKFSPKGWDIFKRYYQKLHECQQKKITMTEILAMLVRDDVQIKAIPYTGAFWGEIDSEDDLNYYQSSLPN